MEISSVKEETLDVLDQFGHFLGTLSTIRKLCFKEDLWKRSPFVITDETILTSDVSVILMCRSESC